MTELPYIFEMDPDDWLEQVQAIADELTDQIAAVLDEHDTAEEAHAALMPHLEPYIIDADDPSQHQILAEADADVLAIGQKGADWIRLHRHDDDFWWPKTSEPDSDDPEELHQTLAKRIVETVSWGDGKRAEERAQNQKAKRTILEPFLKAIEESGGRDAKAIDLREEFGRLIEACLPNEDQMSLEDRSPDDEHTHFVVTRGDDDVGHVLAVSPGASRAPEKLQEAFGIPLSFEAGVRVVTDHLRFVWYPYLGSKTASNQLIPPSEKDDDIVDYYYEIDWTVSQLIRSLNPDLKPEG